MNYPKSKAGDAGWGGREPFWHHFRNTLYIYLFILYLLIYLFVYLLIYLYLLFYLMEDRDVALTAQSAVNATWRGGW